MKKLVTREDVHDLLNASTASAALGAAIETGLFCGCLPKSRWPEKVSPRS